MKDCDKSIGHKIRPKPYIWWTTREIDLNKRSSLMNYLEQLIMNGREEDVKETLHNEWLCEKIRKLLPELNIPTHFKDLWRRYVA